MLQYDQLVKDQTAAPPKYDQQGQAITLDQLKPATPITLPQSTPDPRKADSLVEGANAGQKSLADYIKESTPDATELDTTNQSVLDEIARLTGASTGKDKALAQAKIDAGAASYSKQLAELNGQIAVENASYSKMVADEQAKKAALEANSRGLTTAVLTGQQGAVERQALAERAVKASEIGMLAARAQATSGNLTVALQIAQNAVDAKYGPIEDDLKVKQAQLAAIQPQLTKQQAVQATALQRKYEDEKQKIADEKEKEKQVNNIMVQAAQSGADQQTLDRIQKANSVGDAVAAAGYSLGAEFRQKIAQQEFENKLSQRQVAISAGNLALSRERLNFEITKEAFDQAQKKAGTATPVMQQAMAKSGIDLVGSILKDKNLKEVVGPNALSKGFFAKLGSGQLVTNIGSPGKANFIAGVEQLKSQLSLDALIKAKANGATFGALSEGEMKILNASASKLSTWTETDKNGKVTGYKVSEKDFQRELDRINNFAKLDYVLKGGNPDEVGIRQLPNGKYGTLNSDGSITELE